MDWKKALGWTLVIYIFVVIMFIFIISLSGCASYDVTIGDAHCKLTYLLQDKNFKSLKYNPNTHEVTVENYGSETSQVVESAITAALTVR